MPLDARKDSRDERNVERVVHEAAENHGELMRVCVGS